MANQQKFEELAAGQGLQLAQADDGSYRDPATQAAWELWQVSQRQIVELEGALRNINTMLFAAGAPLGSPNYFDIQKICQDAVTARPHQSRCSDDPLRCPFCGADGEDGAHAEMPSSYHAGCSDPDCIGHKIAYDFVSPEAAIAAWNQRVRASDFLAEPGRRSSWAMLRKVAETDEVVAAFLAEVDKGAQSPSDALEKLVLMLARDKAVYRKRAEGNA